MSEIPVSRLFVSAAELPGEDLGADAVDCAGEITVRDCVTSSLYPPQRFAQISYLDAEEKIAYQSRFRLVRGIRGWTLIYYSLSRRG